MFLQINTNSVYKGLMSDRTLEEVNLLLSLFYQTYF